MIDEDAAGWGWFVDSTPRNHLEFAAVAADTELRARQDVPARVVITEYVDVARAFFEADEPGLVNAVLDSVARKCRPAEFDAATI